MTTAASVFAGTLYPERDEPREGKLDRLLTVLHYFTGSASAGGARLGRIVEATNASAVGTESLSNAELRSRAAALRSRLKQGYSDPALAGEAFALVREAASRTIGQRHFDVQLVGGWALLNGMIAEMDTGEGKTITATLAAATAALSGRAVHVITVNDYLAERDSEWMRPVYEALGITVGCIRNGLDPALRRAAYNCDVTYCSNKEIAFDYLRDRMVLGGRPRPIALRLEALSGTAKRDRLLLRGLQFAIVDEADSVLVDEARTPLILSAAADHSQDEAIHRQALDLAKQLSAADYEVGDQGVERAMKRVATLGDGYISMPVAPEEMARRLDLIEQYAGEAGRSLDNFEVAIHGMVNINDDRRKAYDEAKYYFDNYYVPGYPSEELLQIWLAHGPPEQCARLIQGWIDMGFTTPVLRFAARDQIGQIERFIKDVLPLLRLK